MQRETKILDILERLVAVNSVDGPAEAGAPFGRGPRKALDVMADILSEIGLTPHIVSDVMVYADWESDTTKNDEYIASVSHLDIVEAGSGWDTDPFAITRVGNKIYGRGSLDNKGPSAAVVCAVNKLIKEGYKPHTKFRLLFGSSEEVNNRDIPIYLETELPPIFAFTPDCKFPVVYAEKGIMSFKISTRVKDVGLYVQVPDGQFSDAAVPAEAKMTVLGKNFCAHGKAGHTARPHMAENALTKLATMVVENNDIASDVDDSTKNGIIEYFRFLASLHNDYHGDKIGLGDLLAEGDYDPNNPVTMISVVPYSVEVEDDDIVTYFTLRYPAQLQMDDVVNALNCANIPKPEILRFALPTYVNPDNDYIRKLTDVYSSWAGKHCPPEMASGGTYARVMPNTVGFGPSFPGSQHGIGVAHAPNEYIDIDELYSIIEIYAKAIKALVC